MKKTIILAAMMAVIASASSQTTDTVISFGDRLPYLYYWDTNWVDRYWATNPEMYNPPLAYHFWYEMPLGYYTGHSRFVGRGCTTSTPLKIIGIAGIARIVNYHPDLYTLDTTMQGRLPEYFRLYIPDGDSIRLVAQTRWDTATPYKKLDLTPITSSDPCPLYEAYFDKPVIVDSLFFVGGTAFNSCRIVIPWQYTTPIAQMLGLDTRMVYTHLLTQYGYIIHPGVPSMGCDLTLIIDSNMHDERNLYDTLTTSFSILPYEDHRYMHPFFAIFDTSYIYNPPDTTECLPPTGLRLDNIDTATATLAWNHQDSTLWQLQVFNADSIPDTSTFIDSLSVNMIVLTDLDTGITYAAHLRTLCTADTSSGWTDTIQFRLPAPTNDPGDPNDPDDPTGIDSPQNSPIDLYTHLYPNPATTSLTVISSFHLHKIEIFSADGRLILATPAKGVSTTVDISGLAPATYIVRVTTPSGTATKRLVKK